MGVRIRKMQTRDREALDRMMHELWLIHAIKCRYISKSYVEAADAYREMRKKNKEILVAEAEGKAVGYAYLTVKRAESFFRFKRYLYLDEIFVDTAYRRGGVGLLLLREVKSIARKKGLPILARIYPFSKGMLGLSAKEGGEMLHSTFIFPK